MTSKRLERRNPFKGKFGEGRAGEQKALATYARSMIAAMLLVQRGEREKVIANPRQPYESHGWRKTMVLSIDTAFLMRTGEDLSTP